MDNLARYGRKSKDDAHAPVDIAERRLEDTVPADFTPVDNDVSIATQYNDHPETTHADVMAWFDRAIETPPKRRQSAKREFYNYGNADCLNDPPSMIEE